MHLCMQACSPGHMFSAFSIVADLIKAKPNPGHLYRLGTTAMSGFIPSVLIIIVLGYDG